MAVIGASQKTYKTDLSVFGKDSPVNQGDGLWGLDPEPCFYPADVYTPEERSELNDG